MNELIKIIDNKGKNAVSARELYKFLGYDDTQFNRFLKDKIISNEFAIENIDYQCFDTYVEMYNGGRRILNDAILSIDFAKRISMMAKTSKGEEIRLYFIEIEKTLKQYQLPKTFSEALQLAANQAKQIELQQNQINELEPKAEVYNQISNAENLLTLNEAAKSIGIGRNKMAKLLRSMKIFLKNNIPYQEYIESGYFKTKIKTFQKNNSIENYPQTFITGKGITWLNKIINKA